MAFGDSDLAVFFSVTGDPVVFGSQSTRGHLDAPGAGGMVVDMDVEDDDYSLELARGCLNPMPSSQSLLVVGGRDFKVRSLKPLDDGAIIRYKLKAVK